MGVCFFRMRIFPSGVTDFQVLVIDYGKQKENNQHGFCRGFNGFDCCVTDVSL